MRILDARLLPDGRLVIMEGAKEIVECGERLEIVFNALLNAFGSEPFMKQLNFLHNIHILQGYILRNPRINLKMAMSYAGENFIFGDVLYSGRFGSWFKLQSQSHSVKFYTDADWLDAMPRADDSFECAVSALRQGETVSFFLGDGRMLKGPQKIGDMILPVRPKSMAPEMSIITDAALFGGRKSVFKTGIVDGSVVDYDFRSAYATMLSLVPHVTSIKEVKRPKKDIQCYDDNDLLLVDVKFSFSSIDSIKFFPLPYRAEKDKIVYPDELTSVLFAFELKNAVEYWKVDNLKIINAWKPVYNTDENEPAYPDCATYLRSLAGLPRGSFERAALKRGLNAAWGMTAQRQEGIYYRKSNFWSAAWVAAKVRTYLTALMARDKSAVICCDTDGFVAEHGSLDLPLPEGCPMELEGTRLKGPIVFFEEGWVLANGYQKFPGITLRDPAGLMDEVEEYLHRDRRDRSDGVIKSLKIIGPHDLGPYPKSMLGKTIETEVRYFMDAMPRPGDRKLTRIVNPGGSNGALAGCFPHWQDQANGGKYGKYRLVWR